MTAEEQAILDRATPRLAGMGMNAIPQSPAPVVTNGSLTPTPRPGWHIATRGPSKGKLVRDRKQDERTPAEPVQGGSITREQAQRLADLIGEKEKRRVEWDAALDQIQTANDFAGFRENRFTAASVELDGFIGELTRKG